MMPVRGLRLGSLYSGGKDSTFSIFRAKQAVHEIACLITMHPIADDSPLFHYPNSWVSGRSKEDEMKALEEAMVRAKSLYGIEGIVYGDISSNYQKKAFEEICARHGLAPVAPLWNLEPEKYMSELVDRGFRVIVVGVSAMGLGKEWLGSEIDKGVVAKLALLSRKYGFNLTFEGGEAETLVTDCPLFHKKLQIKKANVHWDGQRGIFEILEVALVGK
jgi:diphthine-ammonia ligase